MLKKIINSENIKILDVNYSMLKKVWCDEFMKVLQFINNDLKKVRGREDVKHRLLQVYKSGKALRLYSFYCAIQLNGIKDVQRDLSKTSFYRNVKDLKEAGVDFSQTYKIVENDNIFWFNPFEYEEVV